MSFVIQVSFCHFRGDPAWPTSYVSYWLNSKNVFALGSDSSIHPLEGVVVVAESPLWNQSSPSHASAKGSPVNRTLLAPVVEQRHQRGPPLV